MNGQLNKNKPLQINTKIEKLSPKLTCLSTRACIDQDLIKIRYAANGNEHKCSEDIKESQLDSRTSYIAKIEQIQL